MSSSINRPVWADLGSQDAEGSRAFYRELLGWTVEPSPDPQFGGYAVAQKDGKDVAGIGPAQSPQQPTAWSVYIGSDDLVALAGRVEAAGGRVIVPAFPVGPMGSMAVFQDSVGAFISGWQAGIMSGFTAEGPGAYQWAEVNARGQDAAVAFYQSVFGWGTKVNAMPMGPYIELIDGDDSVAGVMEMAPMVPADVPSYWMIYFGVSDLDAATATAGTLGANVLVPPTPYPGGHFAILMDPQGATFGLMGD